MFLINDEVYKKNLEKISGNNPYEHSKVLFKDFFENNNNNKYYPFFMRYPLMDVDFFSAADPVYQQQMKEGIIRPLIIMVMDSYDLFSYNNILKKSCYQTIINNLKKKNINEENISFIINNKNINNEIKDIGADKIKAKFYHFDYFLQLLSIKCLEFRQESNFKSHFVSLAEGHPRHHRFGLTFGLYKNNLIQHGVVSCCKWDNFYYRTEGYSINHAPYGMTSENYLKKFKFYKDTNDLKDFIKNLPIIIDNKVNLYNDPMYEYNIFKETFINIVNETHFPNKQLFVTEKTFRSISYSKPFLINGDPGTLSYLKELGFKTFNQYWDESYDTIEDEWKRIEAIIDIIEKITKLDLKQCHDMYKGMLPILKHNHKTLQNINEYKNLPSS